MTRELFEKVTHIQNMLIAFVLPWLVFHSAPWGYWKIFGVVLLIIVVWVQWISGGAFTATYLGRVWYLSFHALTWFLLETAFNDRFGVVDSLVVAGLLAAFLYFELRWLWPSWRDRESRGQTP